MTIRVRQRVRPLALTHFEQFRATYPDFIGEVRQLNAYRERKLDWLGQQSGRDRHTGVRKLLRDRKLHRFYAYNAMRRAGQLATATPNTIDELATRFNAFVPVCDERVATRFVDKGSGKRWVQDFGPRRRMQQALVADILRTLHPPPRTQTLFNGGMPTARAAVATAYREDFTHGVELDFENFYGSVQLEGLADLLRPLPTPVVEHVVWDVAMRDRSRRLTVVVSSDADPTPSALTGLSLGSSTSPIVGERIISDLLAAAEQPDTITYADNLFVMARSEAEMSECIDQIKDSAALCPVGALGLREGFSARRYDLTGLFEFMKQEGEAKADGIHWRPSASKIRQYMVSATDGPLTLDQIATAERRVRNWRRSYRGWDDGDGYEVEYLAALAVRRYYTESSANNLSAALHAVAAAVMAWNGTRDAHEFIPTEGDPQRRGWLRLTSELDRWLDAARERGA